MKHNLWFLHSFSLSQKTSHSLITSSLMILYSSISNQIKLQLRVRFSDLSQKFFASIKSLILWFSHYENQVDVRKPKAIYLFFRFLFIIFSKFFILYNTTLNIPNDIVHILRKHFELSWFQNSFLSTLNFSQCFWEWHHLRSSILFSWPASPVATSFKNCDFFPY